MTQSSAEIMVIEGFISNGKHSFISSLNYDIAKALDADIVFVTQPSHETSDELKNRLELAVSHFGGLANNRIVGCIINKVGAPLDEHGQLRPDLTEMFNPDSPSELVLCDRDVVQVLTQSSLPVL